MQPFLYDRYRWLLDMRANVCTNHAIWYVLFRVISYIDLTEDCTRNISPDEWHNHWGNMPSSVELLERISG